MGVQFTWDERKNRSNKATHGVSFETALLVFEDPYHLSRPDREVEGEPRWHTTGQVTRQAEGEVVERLRGVQVLLVVHTVAGPDERGEETIRIISVRKASPSERRIYAQGL